MNEEPKEIPTWLAELPGDPKTKAYIQQLWLDSSKGGPETSVDPSTPAEGEFRFLLIPQNDTSNSDAVPMLVFIEEDLQDGYFQVMLVHCENAMQTYSDLYVTSGETGLGYGVFISTAIQKQANVICLSKAAVGKLIPSMERSGPKYNFGPDDDWRRGRRFSADLFVAQQDPRWNFVIQQMTEMEYLLDVYEDEGDTRGPELSAKHQAEDEQQGKVDRDNGELLPSQQNNYWHIR
jgi:hypothetical protein